MMTAWSPLSAKALDVCQKGTSILIQQRSPAGKKVLKPSLKMSENYLSDSN